MSPSGNPAALATAVLGALPAAALVVDETGTVRFATEPAAELVERRVEELVGRSALDFVDGQTAWAYAAALAMAGDYAGVVMGPLRISVVTARGARRSADLWATNHLDDPAIGGIVCLVTPASAAAGLAEAITLIAGGADLTVVAARVAGAMRGNPTTAIAAVVAAGPSGMRVVASAEEADLPDLTGPGPWWDAVATGVRRLPADLDELDDALAGPARRLGFRTVWAEPVRADGDPVRGALVLFRSTPGRPSPNELNTVHQAAAILAVAWDRHDRPS